MNIAKITKKEKRLLEMLNCLGAFWIAKNIDGNIFVFFEKPIQYAGIWCCDENSKSMQVNSKIFSFVKKKNKLPINIEDTLAEIKRKKKAKN